MFYSLPSDREEHVSQTVLHGSHLDLIRLVRWSQRRENKGARSPPVPIVGRRHSSPSLAHYVSSPRFPINCV